MGLCLYMSQIPIWNTAEKPNEDFIARNRIWISGGLGISKLNFLDLKVSVRSDKNLHFYGTSKTLKKRLCLKILVV